MSHEEIRAFLWAQRVAHVATKDAEGWPYVLPLAYVFEDDVIYLHTGAHGSIGIVPHPIWQEFLAKARILLHRLPGSVGVGQSLASVCSASVREGEADGLLLPRKGDDGRS